MKNTNVNLAKQLEDMTQALRKKTEENKYLKDTTAAYISKKEAELNVVKSSLEHQIEELKKTQRSMYFMIEDLNEMSAQLKDARDHLEEKVKERTDELLKIGEKLHRSERLAFLGKLAGSVTHELKNPLATLTSTAYCLDKILQGRNDKEESKYMAVINKEIKLIDSIINDIMGFAKVHSLEISKVKPKDIIEEVIASIDIPKLIEIKKEFQVIPEINIDKRKLIHALTNIANNAIMAMKGNGSLTFRVVKHKDNFVCFQTEDTGPGIPESQRDLIFEPLYSAKPKGTGLGLPIAKMMIEMQGGYIEFESMLNKGTLFKIFLPMNLEERIK